MNPVAQVKEIYWKNPKTEEVVPAYREVQVWCPGCSRLHDFTVAILDPSYTRSETRPEPVWDWDGNLENPTFNPSMLAFSSVHICEDEHPPVPCLDYENCEERSHLIMNDDWRVVGPKEYGHTTPHTRDPAWGNCHSFLHNGIWNFLDDCAHKLRGHHPMVPLPDWVVKFDE